MSGEALKLLLHIKIKKISLNGTFLLVKIAIISRLFSTYFLCDQHYNIKETNQWT